ncbi:hypothetical protein C2869_09775 [Saccharobesus litoralis]|uniref:NarX-like N-terminal domain-containing protein n=1 Tax=Saccharobesus litoralis TaxID=2172099 RepID=A0A2S0VR59_9ALTE|nr:type IV pili methyl-accepting chemotaxis transducer N-terminal domain-containing protein [Saccharobesus litoralis]AWB66701.1 hypothetical protein C2869_09775 [Saccharobesus litoralis]
MNVRKLLALMALFPCLMLPYTSYASTPDAVDIAGRQRMLTQKMTKEALLVGLQPNTASYVQALVASQTLFHSSLQALKSGDSRQNIPKPSSKELRQIGEIERLWQPFSSVIDEIAQAKFASYSAIEQLISTNDSLLKESNKLVQIMASTVEDEQDEAKVNRVNLAGRQRMLSQRLAKQALSVCYHVDFFQNKNTATQTTSTFDLVLNGLINGSELLELEESTTSDEEDKLDEVYRYWSDYLAVINPVLDISYSVCSVQQIALIDKRSLDVLKNMNQAVQIAKAN